MHNFKRLKWILSFVSLILLPVLLTACDGGKSKIAKQEANTLRIGVTPGSEQRFMQEVKEVAAEEYDLNIQLVPYTALADLNKALFDKEIDANVFQHHFYLQYSEEKYGYDFTELGRTYIYPIGVYSKKIKSILHLPKGAVIAIPNEPTNEARALFLLEKAGLIRMKSDEDMDADVEDIAANPSHFQILRLPSKEITSMVATADLVVLNIGHAIPAGLIPSKDALVIENSRSAYASIVVVRKGEENDPRMRAFIEVLHSYKVQQAAEEIFYGQAVPAWK